MLVTLAACASDPGAADAKRQLQVASDPAAILRIATAAERAGDPASAAAFYRRAADLQPDSDTAAIGVARSLVELDRTDEAIDRLRGVHLRRPDDTLIAATLGRLLVVAHRPQDALAAFADGLHADPRSASLLIGQGVALDATGQHGAAQDSYRAALSLTPDSIPAKNNLALSLAITGHAEEAVALLRALQSTTDTADRATVDGNLALAYGLQGDAANAAATARRALPDRHVAANLAAHVALKGQGTPGGAGAATGEPGMMLPGPGPLGAPPPADPPGVDGPN